MPALSDSELNAFYVVGGVVLLLLALAVYAYLFPAVSASTLVGSGPSSASFRRHRAASAKFAPDSASAARRAETDALLLDPPAVAGSRYYHRPYRYESPGASAPGPDSRGSLRYKADVPRSDPTQV